MNNVRVRSLLNADIMSSSLFNQVSKQSSYVHLLNIFSSCVSFCLSKSFFHFILSIASIEMSAFLSEVAVCSPLFPAGFLSWALLYSMFVEELVLSVIAVSLACGLALVSFWYTNALYVVDLL